MRTLSDILTRHLDEYKRQLISDQKAKGIRATGQSAASLEVKVGEEKAELLGSDYFYFQEHGRAPGNMPPVRGILRWMQAKGVDGSAYAIAKGIADRGTRAYQRGGTDLLSDVFTEESLNTLTSKLSEAASQEVVQNITKLWQSRS